jgi:diguanylate cyclase (GGDEF)-like protein/PAS domain S-box-containing protein
MLRIRRASGTAIAGKLAIMQDQIIAAAPDLPETVQVAAQMAGLDGFLDDVGVGFHWEMLDLLEDGVYIMDRDRRILYWSTGAERITGYGAAEVLGRRCADNLLRHVDERGRALCIEGCPLAAVMDDGRPRSADVFLHHKDGHRVPVHVHGAPIRNWHGEIIGAFETFWETASPSADLERIRQLEQLAFLDSLTGLANRRYMESAMRTRFADFRDSQTGFGAILIDVDHFKRFNDTYGHASGDRVLRMVASTLAGNCRPFDAVGRWGGEEFLVLAGHAAVDQIGMLAERLRALVAESSLMSDGNVLRVTISLGATIARSGDDPATLLQRADELLYRSKSEGRNRVTFVP